MFYTALPFFFVIDALKNKKTPLLFYSKLIIDVSPILIDLLLHVYDPSKEMNGVGAGPKRDLSLNTASVIVFVSLHKSV